MSSFYRKTTVHDVARHAGVSQSTVSHFINGRTSVCSQETAARISQAIEELHFSPGRALRHHRSQANKTIGICVQLSSEGEDELPYTYLHRFWSGVSQVVDEYSYRILHFPRSMRDGASCSPFLDGSIDGLLISASHSESKLDVFSQAGLPVVCVVRSSNIPPGCGSVVANEENVVDLAMSHLGDLGHRRIAFLGASIGQGRQLGISAGVSDSALKRHSHYRRWMEERGEDGEQMAVFAPGYCSLPLEDALVAVDYWMALASPPTAVFCGNDRMARSVIRGFQERGFRVPEDISVVGVDNEGASAAFDPPLTSVEVPVHEVGRQATAMLIEMVTGKTEASQVEVPVHYLNVGKSTSEPRKSGVRVFGARNPDLVGLPDTALDLARSKGLHDMNAIPCPPETAEPRSAGERSAVVA